jgi:argininosuccinate lyase
MAKVTIQLNLSQIMNVEQGLQMLHGKLLERLQSIHSKDEKAIDLRLYYKEKIDEVSKQIGECKKAISDN